MKQIERLINEQPVTELVYLHYQVITKLNDSAEDDLYAMMDETNLNVNHALKKLRNSIKEKQVDVQEILKITDNGNNITTKILEEVFFEYISDFTYDMLLKTLISESMTFKQILMTRNKHPKTRLLTILRKYNKPNLQKKHID